MKSSDQDSRLIAHVPSNRILVPRCTLKRFCTQVCPRALRSSYYVSGVYCNSTVLYYQQSAPLHCICGSVGLTIYSFFVRIMLAQRSTITQVKTPGEQFAHQSRPSKRYDISKEGGKGLVAADGQQIKMSVRVLNENGKAISAGREPSTSKSTRAASVQMIYHSQIAPRSKSKARSRVTSPASGARVMAMSLPGQNKGKPTLEDAESQRLEDVHLPGQNQIVPIIDEIGPPGGPGPAPAGIDMSSGMSPPSTAPPGSLSPAAITPPQPP